MAADLSHHRRPRRRRGDGDRAYAWKFPVVHRLRSGAGAGAGAGVGARLEISWNASRIGALHTVEYAPCAVGSRRRALFWPRSTVRANQSECSQRPFEEAELRKSPLEVVAALYVHPAAEGVPNRDRAFEALQTVMREAIEPLVCELSEERPQVDVRLKFPIGYPAEVLSNASPSAQLLIVGSHGGGGFAGMGLGSISNAVAHEAHCPVLVVRESARRQ